MYSVIRIEANKDLNDKTQKFVHIKEFKSLKPALKMAYKKNGQISTQVLNEMYVIYDRKNNQVLRSELN
jgi:hypothetical protein